jgi:GDP-L-fucose synthase
MDVLVAGSSGLAGSAILTAFLRKGYKAGGLDRTKVDLLDYDATLDFVTRSRPTFLIDAAAKVGGIFANNTAPVDYLFENIQIQNNLMRAAHVTGVKRFIFLGSSCIYPRDSLQPIKEDYLMTGPLEETNSAYAIAKLTGMEMVKSYRRQFSHNWISLMPTNLYGPNDNFNLTTSHVLPAFVRKFVEATESEEPEVTLWGDGSPRREFLHADDLAHAVVLTADLYDSDIHLNVGTGEDISIKELADLVSKATGFQGRIMWDNSKPNGTPRKVLDVSRIKKLGWKPAIPLEEGIASTISWYRQACSSGKVRK